MSLHRLIQRTSRFLAVTAVAFGLTAGNALATDYNVGGGATPGDLTLIGNWSGGTGTFAGAFSDSWKFSLSGGSNDFSGLLTSTFTTKSGSISWTSIVLNGPSLSIPWTLVTPAPGFQYANYSGSLPTGLYSFDVSGTGTSSSSYSVDFAAAVPEPSQWLMLFAGIALLGATVRRRAF